MIKFKHFYHIEGSDAERKSTAAFLDEVEAFINDNKINPVEISHNFTPLNPRCLSVFVTYVEIDQKVKDAIAQGVAQAVEQTKKEAEAKSTPTSDTKKPTLTLPGKKPTNNS